MDGNIVQSIEGNYVVLGPLNDIELSELKQFCASRYESIKHFGQYENRVPTANSDPEDMLDNNITLVTAVGGERTFEVRSEAGDSDCDINAFLDVLHERAMNALEEFDKFQRGEYSELMNKTFDKLKEKEQSRLESEGLNEDCGEIYGRNPRFIHEVDYSDPREDESDEDSISDQDTEIYKLFRKEISISSDTRSSNVTHFLKKFGSNLHLATEVKEVGNLPRDQNEELPLDKVLKFLSSADAGSDIEAVETRTARTEEDFLSSDVWSSEEDLSDYTMEEREPPSDILEHSRDFRSDLDTALQRKMFKSQRSPPPEKNEKISEFVMIERGIDAVIAAVECQNTPSSTNPDPELLLDNLTLKETTGLSYSSESTISSPIIAVDGSDGDKDCVKEGLSTSMDRDKTAKINRRELRRKGGLKRRLIRPRSTISNSSKENELSVDVSSDSGCSDPNNEIILDDDGHDDDVQLVKDNSEIQFLMRVKAALPLTTNDKRHRRKGSLAEVVELLDASSSSDTHLPNFATGLDTGSDSSPSRKKARYEGNSDVSTVIAEDDSEEHLLPTKQTGNGTDTLRPSSPIHSMTLSDTRLMHTVEVKNSTECPASISLPSAKHGRRKIRRIRVMQNSALDALDEKHKEAEEAKCKLQEINTEASRLKLSSDPAIEVDPSIACELKSHQREGIQFLWTLCFCTGSGAILSHCMGLGKTLQALAFLHTLLTHPILGITHCVILCPLNIVCSWENESQRWFSNVKKKINFLNLSDIPSDSGKLTALQNYRENGGIVLVHYDLFRVLVDHQSNNVQESGNQNIALETVANSPPASESGPNPESNSDQQEKPNPVAGSLKVDLRTLAVDVLMNPNVLVCDEGHLLKNGNTLLSQVIKRIPTRRKIILTGTPIQNNLKEYYFVIDLVQPGILGELSLFSNNYINPIANGQHVDSNENDIKIARRREYNLTELTKKFIHRPHVRIIRDFIPAKYELGIFLNLTDLQKCLYFRYLNAIDERIKQSRLTSSESTSAPRLFLFEDYSAVQKFCCHPLLLYKEFSKSGKIMEKKRRPAASQPEAFDAGSVVPWFDSVIPLKDREEISRNPNISSKMFALKEIVQSSIRRGEKLLIFSRYVYALDVIQYFIRLDAFGWGELVLNEDYYRIDGHTHRKQRDKFCSDFNASHRAKLFLITTKAGGLGVNLHAANRVIMVDVSMNPSDDEQSIFRIYRIGQKKECFIYRLISRGGMEEKTYNRGLVKLAIGGRIVDQQHSQRRLKHHNTANLYEFNPESIPVGAIDPKQVKDPVFQDLLRNSQVVASCVEHQTLFEDHITEHLNEEQKEVARQEEDILAQARVSTDASKKRSSNKTGHKSLSQSHRNSHIPQELNSSQITTNKTVDVSLPCLSDNLDRPQFGGCPESTSSLEFIESATTPSLLPKYNSLKLMLTTGVPSDFLNTGGTPSHFKQRPQIHSRTQSEVDTYASDDSDFISMEEFQRVGLGCLGSASP